MVILGRTFTFAAIAYPCRVASYVVVKPVTDDVHVTFPIFQTLNPLAYIHYRRVWTRHIFAEIVIFLPINECMPKIICHSMYRAYSVQSATAHTAHDAIAERSTSDYTETTW